MKKILITTGGTGGHVMPALNIFDHLNKKFDVKIVTDIRGKKFINKNKYSFDTIKINQISKNIFKLPFSLALMFISIIKGYLYLKKKQNKISYKYRRVYVSPILFACKIFKYFDHII